MDKTILSLFTYSVSDEKVKMMFPSKQNLIELFKISIRIYYAFHDCRKMFWIFVNVLRFFPFSRFKSNTGCFFFYRILFIFVKIYNLLQWNKTRRMSSSNTGSSVLNRFVSHWEFTKVMTNHFRLDFNLVKGLSIVNTDDGSDHLRNNDHVSKMRLNDLRLLIWRCFLLGLTQFLNKRHWLSLQTVRETPAGTGVHKLGELFAINNKSQILIFNINLLIESIFQFLNFVNRRKTEL